MIFLISFLWFIREIKSILFWLYLWQLKEYHLGRFWNHFRTEKGKKLFFNFFIFFKIILFLYALSLAFYPKLLAWYFYAFWILILTIIYFFESAKTILDFFQKKLKKPILTQKTKTLILISLTVVFSFLFFLFQRLKLFYWFFFSLLSFDILTPFFVSGIVLLLQPLTVYWRNKILQRAKEKRAKFKDLFVIGITGSYGKTSTKEFLATILEEKFPGKVLKTKEHQNSEVGISQCILDDLKPEHQIFVVEMGAYNRGGIKLLCKIAKPKIGILTGINEQHLATFGSLENIIKTKYELIESLPEDGLAIFNGDNNYCYELYKKTDKPKRIYSFQSTIGNLPTDIYVSSLAINRDFLSFKVLDKEGNFAIFKVNLLGEQNVSNILAAVCVAKELGMNLEEIAKACKKIESWQSGMVLKKGINKLNIIDATYSANPDGVISHLEFLKIWPGKKVIVMPCLIELGKASKRIHREIGRKIGEICDLTIITTAERFREIGEGAIEKGMKGENILFTDNPKEIFEKIKTFCQAGDIVLLEGRVPPELINLLYV